MTNIFYLIKASTIKLPQFFAFDYDEFLVKSKINPKITIDIVCNIRSTSINKISKITSSWLDTTIANQLIKDDRCKIRQDNLSILYESFNSIGINIAPFHGYYPEQFKSLINFFFLETDDYYVYDIMRENEKIKYYTLQPMYKYRSNDITLVDLKKIIDFETEEK